MNKGGGGEIQRSQVNPRPLGKKTKKTWAISRINFTSETDLPVWSSTFLSHEKTCNDPLEQLQNTPQLIYMSLNKNSVYCVMPRSSKPPDTCK